MNKLSRKNRRVRYGINTASIRQLLKNRDKAVRIQRAHDTRPTRDSKIVAAKNFKALNASVPCK